MTEFKNRRLWLDTRGVPVITTTANGKRNAERWGWTPATARPLPTREEIANALHGDNCPDDPDPDEYCSCGAGDYDRMGDIVLALLKGQGA